MWISWHGECGREKQARMSLEQVLFGEVGEGPKEVL